MWSSGIKYKYCDCFLEYTKLKVDLIEYKCLNCKNSYQWKLNKTLKQRFFNTYKFYNHDNNKFVLLLLKRWLGKIQWSLITWKWSFL